MFDNVISMRYIIIILISFLVSFSNISVCQQYNENKKIEFGIGGSFHYDYKVSHYALVFNTYIKQNNIYAGPMYTSVYENMTGDPVNTYDDHAYGLNVGYRYFIGKRKKDLKPFIQIEFMIFWQEYYEQQLGPPNVTEHTRIIVENTISVGIDYTINSGLHVSGGLGFGSYDGLFLIFNNFTPTSYIGIEYRF